MKVWGVSVSYFTGKLEAYLRYKSLKYEFEHPFADQARIREQVGAIQVPLLERDDGRWMSDSTPILRHLDQEHPEPSVYPEDQVVRFIALLIEDYADEWLWRAAMHYRWSYEHDRELLSRILADEVTTHLRLPRFIRCRLLKKRQYKHFVLNDGVAPQTRQHVEAGYRQALANMTTMLGDQPYLLGDRPSIADFGMMGPMLRHFGQDPTPAEIMRNEAPIVFDWLSRVWNAEAKSGDKGFLETVPDNALPMLKEIAETHLVQLRENAAAFENGQSHFEMTVQGCRYQNLLVSQYRVHCLEQLRGEFALLDKPSKEVVKSLLIEPDCEVLWDQTNIASGYDPDKTAPFNKAINVFQID
jgi:glutathione S-transferase